MVTYFLDKKRKEGYKLNNFLIYLNFVLFPGVPDPDAMPITTPLGSQSYL